MKINYILKYYILSEMKINLSNNYTFLPTIIDEQGNIRDSSTVENLLIKYLFKCFYHLKLALYNPFLSLYCALKAAAPFRTHHCLEYQNNQCECHCDRDRDAASSNLSAFVVVFSVSISTLLSPKCELLLCSHK